MPPMSPRLGRVDKKENKLWRIHSAFDLPSERFGHFELTDQREGSASSTSRP